MMPFGTAAIPTGEINLAVERATCVRQMDCNYGSAVNCAGPDYYPQITQITQTTTSSRLS